MENFNSDKMLNALVENSVQEENAYAKKVDEYINALDLKRLAEIKKKSLEEIQEKELAFIGFYKTDHAVGNIYGYQNLNGEALYFTKTNKGFAQRGYELKEDVEIVTAEKLLECSLINWRLRLNRKRVDWKEFAE